MNRALHQIRRHIRIILISFILVTVALVVYRMWHYRLRIGGYDVPNEWKSFEAKGAFGTVFTFHAPPDMKILPVRGIDSSVGMFAGDSMILAYDCGPWTGPEFNSGFFTGPPRRREIICGREVSIVYFSDSKMAIPEVVGAPNWHSDSEMLSVYWGKGEKDECALNVSIIVRSSDCLPQALAVIRSIESIRCP